MFHLFDDRAKRALSNARQVALEMRHDSIDTEHVLLALLRDDHSAAVALLAELGVEPERLRNAIERLMAPGPENRELPSQLPFTARAKTALEATFHSLARLSHDSIGTQHLLIGLVCTSDDALAPALAELGLDVDRVEQTVRCKFPPAPGAPRSSEIVLGILSQEMLDAFRRSAGRLRPEERVDVPRFLASLLDEPGYLTRLLERLGVDVGSAREAITDDLRRDA